MIPIHSMGHSAPRYLVLSPQQIRNFFSEIQKSLPDYQTAEQLIQRLKMGPISYCGVDLILSIPHGVK